jgi:ABC-type glycerol-3-phosphate transport system permease component
LYEAASWTAPTASRLLEDCNPLIRPALATVAIYNLVPIWNDLWFPLIFINLESQKTVLLA